MSQFNSIFISVLLVEEADGTPSVVTAPAHRVTAGDIVTFGNRTAKVVKVATVDPKDEVCAILSAIISVHEADCLYAPSYITEAEKDAP